MEGEAFIKPETGTVQKCFKNEVAIDVGRSAVDAHECASRFISGMFFPVPGVRDVCKCSVCVEPS